MGYRGSLIISDTWGNFGALIGLSGVRNNIFTTGWEDGNAGWGSPGPLTGGSTGASAPPAGQGAQCSSGGCDTLGANFWSIPNNVPANVTTGGLVAGPGDRPGLPAGAQSGPQHRADFQHAAAAPGPLDV